MSQNQNRFVLPGDVIPNDSSILKQNVILEGDKLVSTTIGFTEINDGEVEVIALTGLYTSEVDDLVIGKIVSHNSLSWEDKSSSVDRKTRFYDTINRRIYWCIYYYWSKRLGYF